jgi:NADH-quinone oxidoreductase subunit G
MDQLITLKIDGREISVPAGTTVLTAARKLGIEIPTFCDYAKLTPVGACRMCLVEIEKMRGLQTACSTVVRPDLVVHTDTPEVIKTRAATLEFLLTNHPLDCPVCDKGGECDLQDQVFAFGPARSRFIEEKRHKAKARILGEHLIMDQERCVLCRRCIRFLQEWADDQQLGIIERGRNTYVDTFYGDPLDSIFAGNVVDLCPVGALTSRAFRFSARSWELTRTDSICVNCAVGCNISLHTKVARLKRIVARPNMQVNDEWLCDRGRFDHRVADPAARVTRPLLRIDGELKPAPWEAALDLAAQRLRSFEPAAIGVIGSGHASNEANYLAQRLARACLQTNNLALEAPPPPRVRLISSTRQLEAPGVVLIVGLDLEAEAPLLELLGRHAGVMGCTRFIIVHSQVNSQATRLTRFGLSLPVQAGTEAALLHGIVHLLIKKGLTKGGGNVEALKEWVADYTPTKVAGITGVAPQALEAAAGALGNAKGLTALYGRATFATPGLANALTNLALLAGAVGPAYIPTEANAIGALDMGVSSQYLPGYQSYDDQRVTDRLAQLWSRSKLPRQPGLGLAEMAAAAKGGPLKAAYCLGKPPAYLKGLELLVVQTSWVEAVGEADIVLPACGFAEAEGTYTNLCGHVQVGRPALRPMGDSQPDWWILAQLGGRLGKAELWAFASAQGVFAEIAKVTPAYAGLSYEALGAEGKSRHVEEARLGFSL